MKLDRKLLVKIILFSLICWIGHDGRMAFSQTQTVSTGASSGTPGKPITIPLAIHLKGLKPEPELQMIDLAVSEDGEPQTILSVRAMGTNSPLTLAILIQDDVVSSIANEIKPLGNFIRQLPRGSRVLVGYVRTGTLQVRQKFTTDLEKAAKALRVPIGLPSAAPYNPYVEVIEALKRFESQPTGRRAILLISDGLDTSRGIDTSSPADSVDLQRAINEAQRRSVAVYSFYAPTDTAVRNHLLAANAQGSLARLSDESGGRAFFEGTGVPVSFDPFIRDLDSALNKQVALTYLSTHPNKGFHRLAVRSSTPGVEVDYPAGYTR